MFSRSVNQDILSRIFLISERLIVLDGLTDVFEHIVKTAVTLVRAEAATIRVFDFEQGKLEIVKGYGLSQGFLSQPPIRVGEGITGRVVLTGEPFIAEDVRTTDHCANKEFAKLEGIRSVMSIPMRTQDRCVGCITVYRKEKESFSPNDLLILNIFGMQAAEAIEKTNLLNELKQQATYDHLTKIYNRHTLMTAIEKNMSISLRHEVQSSIIFIDIDNFKQFNDTHGHLLGDKLLRDIGQIMKKNIRQGDSVGRFGGEEFVVLAPHTGKKQAVTLARKLLDAVSNHIFIGKDNAKVTVTFSAGVATFSEDGNTSDSVLKKADEAMYQSKASGKNRVTAWKEKRPSARRHPQPATTKQITDN